MMNDGDLAAVPIGVIHEEIVLEIKKAMPMVMSVLCQCIGVSKLHWCAISQSLFAITYVEFI